MNGEDNCSPHSSQWGGQLQPPPQAVKGLLQPLRRCAPPPHEWGGQMIQTRLEERLQKEADLSWAEFELLMRLRVSAAHPLQMSENRRIVRVQLTDHGREVLSKADEVIQTNVQEVLADHLTETEVTELRALLRKLLEKNGAWQEARCAPL